MAFTGKAAIVTGAARGIGAAVSKSLAAQGATVFLNDINDAQETVDEIIAAGGMAEFIQGDVTQLTDLERLVETTVERTGRMDVLVANAAYSVRGTFYEQPIEDVRKTVEVSMWGVYNAIRAVSARMVSMKRGGAIVVIGSPHAYVPVPKCMAYNMAKAAVDHLAKTAAAELLPHRVRVNIVHPGWTDTPGERRHFTDNDIRELGSRLPVGRLAQPAEIARAVVFLADDDSEYINGSTLTVDGGLQLPRKNIVDML